MTEKQIRVLAARHGMALRKNKDGYWLQDIYNGGMCAGWGAIPGWPLEQVASWLKEYTDESK